MMEILEIRDLHKRFGSHEVLSGLNMVIPEHTIFGFVGQNGAGKTTTMKIVLGLLRPDGGEVAVSVMLEAIPRLMPGFMGNPDSIVEESYTGEGALLEHRQYTKPAVWRGIAVPDVLLSGDHGKVDRFRRDEALARTAEIRPDLIAALDCKALDKADRKTLMALGWEVSAAHPRGLAD